MGEMMGNLISLTDEPEGAEDVEAQDNAAQQLMNEYFKHSHQAKEQAVAVFDVNEIISCGWDNVAAQWAQTATLVAIHNELHQIKNLMAAELHLKLPAEETEDGDTGTPVV